MAELWLFFSNTGNSLFEAISLEVFRVSFLNLDHTPNKCQTDCQKNKWIMALSIFHIKGHLSVLYHISQIVRSFKSKIDTHANLYMRTATLWFSKLQLVVPFRGISLKDFGALNPNLTRRSTLGGVHIRIYRICLLTGKKHRMYP